MNLWIRSQDKQTLTKVNNLFIDDEVIYMDGKICLMDNCTTLGRYETKERALEVLDEIQRLITDLQWESYAIENKKFTGHRDCVYEMPKE